MKRLSLLLIAVLWLTAACGGGNVAEVPTEVQIPTRTPTDTPPPPTDTPLPTDTPFPTWTPTLTATHTLTPSDTPTSTLTPSDTPTPTASLTLTPSDTPTPTATATPAEPSIVRFEVTPERVEQGGDVQIRWDAIGDTVLVQILDGEARPLRAVSLDTSGERTITLPDGLQDLAILSLQARRGETVARQDRVLVVLCRFNWFFNVGDVSSVGCPEAAPITAIGRYQTFERGYMLYIPTTNQIYALYGGTASGTWVAYNNSGGGSLLDDPPDNLFNAQNEFTYTWNNINAPTQRAWRQEIGYGTAPAVQAQVSVQDERNSRIFYMGTADGLLFRMEFYPQQLTVGTWRRVS